MNEQEELKSGAVVQGPKVEFFLGRDRGTVRCDPYLEAGGALESGNALMGLDAVWMMFVAIDVRKCKPFRQGLGTFGFN